MLSILQHMDEYDIAKEIEMERAVHKGSFMLVEGSTDYKRFAKFVDESQCSIVTANSRTKAIGALRLLEGRKFTGVLAVVDADFERVTGSLVISPNLVYSDSHDLDLDWISSPALHEYLGEVADDVKLAVSGGASAVLAATLDQLRPVSAARLLGSRRVFKFKTNDIKVGDFFALTGDLTDAVVDYYLSVGRLQAGARAWAKQQISTEVQRGHDLKQFTNGHDVCVAMGVLLKADIGWRKWQQAWGSEVERGVRLAFCERHFGFSSVFSQIEVWEDNNPPYRVLQ